MTQSAWLSIAAACLLVAAACLGSIVTMVRGARRPKEAEPQVVREWTATGRVNITANPDVLANPNEDVQSLFVLRVEENRLIADLAGSSTVETRWRNPTKREAKAILAQYNSHMAFVPHEKLINSPFEDRNVTAMPYKDPASRAEEPLFPRAAE